MKKFSTDELLQEVEAAKKILIDKISAQTLPPHIKKKNELLQRDGVVSNASNNSSTKELFEGHKNYKELVNELNYSRGEFKNGFSLKNQIDTWYKEPRYGRVNNKDNLIYTSYFLYVDISDRPTKCVCVFDFVATAFEKMKMLYGIMTDRKTSSLYLKDLQAVDGPCSTINLEDKYVDHLDEIYSDFYQDVLEDLRNSDRIKNYDDFYHLFMNYVKNNNKILSFAGFIESINSDVYDSYLSFDIAETSESNPDTEKIRFLEDVNYPAYDYAARMTGFRIDPNKPWRLIADLGTDRMLQAIRETRVQRESDLVNITTNIELVQNLISDYEASLAKADSFTEKDLKGLVDSIQKMAKLLMLPEQLEPKKNDMDNVVPWAYSTYNNVIFPRFNKIFTEKKILEITTKSLSFSKKPMESIKLTEVYGALYFTIYDYAFMTYIPIKMVEFYNKFIGAYPNYGSVSFEGKKGATKFNKLSRVTKNISEEKLIKNKINDFYKFMYLEDFAEIRNLESNKLFSKQEMKSIVVQMKHLYEISVKSEADKQFSNKIRNYTMKILESSLGMPSQKNTPIEYRKDKENTNTPKNKKTSILAVDTIITENTIEPRILTERLCVKPAADLAPGFISEVCPEFPVDLPQITLPMPPPKPAPPITKPSKPKPPKKETKQTGYKYLLGHDLVPAMITPDEKKWVDSLSWTSQKSAVAGSDFYKGKDKGYYVDTAGKDIYPVWDFTSVQWKNQGKYQMHNKVSPELNSPRKLIAVVSVPAGLPFGQGIKGLQARAAEAQKINTMSQIAFYPGATSYSKVVANKDQWIEVFIGNPSEYLLVALG